MSENESEKRETLAAIAAELRDEAARADTEQYYTLDDAAESMREYAERIEAIDSADAWRSLYAPPVGNTAAMRDAMVKIRRELNTYCKDSTLIDRMTEDPPDYTCLRDSLLEIERIVDAALSAPARQCDVGTAEEQTDRMWDGYCRKYECLVYEHGVERHCPLYHHRGMDCRLIWAQMPYEAQEGGAE